MSVRVTKRIGRGTGVSFNAAWILVPVLLIPSLLCGMGTLILGHVVEHPLVLLYYLAPPAIVVPAVSVFAVWFDRRKRRP